LIRFLELSPESRQGSELLQLVEKKIQQGSDIYVDLVFIQPLRRCLCGYGSCWGCISWISWSGSCCFFKGQKVEEMRDKYSRLVEQDVNVLKVDSKSGHYVKAKALSVVRNKQTADIDRLAL